MVFNKGDKPRVRKPAAGCGSAKDAFVPSSTAYIVCIIASAKPANTPARTPRTIVRKGGIPLT